MPSSPSTLGDFLRYYRLRAGLTQEELGQRAGVSVRAIRDMERGRALSPRRRTVELLAEALSLDDVGVAALAGSPEVVRTADAPAGVSMVPVPSTALIGRDRELRWLAERARQAADRVSTDVIVLFGAPGTGKTALAARAAHQLRDAFPDGVVHVDLRGADPVPRDPVEVMREVLCGIGVFPRDVPGGRGERSALYRSVLGTHAVLVVLDNAAGDDQVRPLLAASPGSMVLITTRTATVAVDVAVRRELELLGAADAVSLLAAVAGEDRVRAEPEAAAQVAELCGGVPLALRIAGDRLAASPGWPVATLAGELADERGRLDALRIGDVQVRAAFDLSYRLLSPAAARLFRRLALVPGTDAGVDLAAVVADLEPREAERELERLVDVSLLRTAEMPGRYGYHDLIRLYAGQRAELDEGLPGVRRIREGAAGWLLANAAAAAQHFHPDDPPPPGRTRYADRSDASRWLADERTNWLGAFRLAAADGRHQQVVDVARAMHWYSDYRGTPELWLEVYSASVSAAESLGSPGDIAVHRNFLSWTLTVLMGRPLDAVEMSDAALDAAKQAGDTVEQAWALLYGAAALWRCGRPAEAATRSESAVELFAEAGHLTGEHIAISSMAHGLSAVGLHGEALAAHRHAVDLHGRRQHANPPTADENLAGMLVRMSQTLIELGRFDEADRALREAESLAERNQALEFRASVQQARAQLMIAKGDLSTASAQLVAVLESTDRRDSLWQVLVMLAQVAQQLGDPVFAVECRVRALALYREYDLPDLANSDALAGLLEGGAPG